MFFWNSCFFHDPVDVGNLISVSSAFSKSSFCIWKFLVHVLLKPSLKDFEHYLDSMWNEHNKAQKWYGPNKSNIKKKWQEYTELYKKDLHDPDNHDGVITHLEPDILECEVKWPLGSITINKASGGDGILVELFQIPKGDAVKVVHSICQQIWKTQQWPQDW